MRGEKKDAEDNLDSPGPLNSSGSKTDTEEAKIWTDDEHCQLRWSQAPCTDGVWALLDSATFQELQSWKEDLQWLIKQRF